MQSSCNRRFFLLCNVLNLRSEKGTQGMFQHLCVLCSRPCCCLSLVLSKTKQLTCIVVFTPFYGEQDVCKLISPSTENTGASSPTTTPRHIQTEPHIQTAFDLSQRERGRADSSFPEQGDPVAFLLSQSYVVRQMSNCSS